MNAEACRGVFISLFKRNLAVLLALSLWGQGAWAADEPSARQWLEKMSSALQQISYRGVFVYRSDQEMAAMQVTHVADEKGEHELLETLTGEPRREVRNTALLQGSLDDGESPLADIEKFYSLEVVGQDRAAGRMTYLLNVQPKDEFRYGYRLWIDQETGLLLRSEMLAGKDHVLEQVMFTSLELLTNDQRPKSLLEQSVPEVSQASGKGVASNWVVEKLPGGFELMDHRIKGDEHKVEHLLFSDGLASVSVFIESSEGASDAFVGVSTMGAVNAFGSTYDGFQVTVVGEVPKTTVMAIGQSIKPRSQESND